jgi:hypothetical protein
MPEQWYNAQTQHKSTAPFEYFDPLVRGKHVKLIYSTFSNIQTKSDAAASLFV